MWVNKSSHNDFFPTLTTEDYFIYDLKPGRLTKSLRSSDAYKFLGGLAPHGLANGFPPAIVRKPSGRNLNGNWIKIA